jgi:hypothetical protein
LTDRKVNALAARWLEELDWQPSNEAEWVHYMVARRDTESLTTPENWPRVKRVLLADAWSGRKERVELAVWAFTGIGDDSVLPDLLQVIRTRGTYTIALAYLNSRRAVLRKAARAWARANGYKVITLRGTPGATWQWGVWN